MLACLTFHKNVGLYKSSVALLLEGQAICSILETVGYLSALGSSFRVPGQPSIGRAALCASSALGPGSPRIRPRVPKSFS